MINAKIKVNENNKEETLKTFIEEVKNPELPIIIIDVGLDGEDYKYWRTRLESNVEGIRVINEFENQEEAEEFTRQIAKQTKGIIHMHDTQYKKGYLDWRAFSNKVKKWRNED